MHSDFYELTIPSTSLFTSNIETTYHRGMPVALQNDSLSGAKA